MKERQTKIGMFRIVQNDSGLTFYPQSGFEDKGEWYTFTNSAADELKNWLSGYKEIPYRDRTYLDKRKLLRQLSIKDEIRNYVNIMTDKILEKLKRAVSLPNYIDEIEMYHYIKTLLVDGFLAFEVIFDSNQKNIIGLKIIDVCSLTPVSRSSTGEIKNDFDWIQYQDNEKMKRVLSHDQVIYISYSDSEPISYVEELKTSYEKVITLENELMASRMNLPGDVSKKLGGEIAFKQLKRADKNLKFVSKIPKSILENEETESNDVRYNNFVKKMYEKLHLELFDILIDIKHKLNN